MNDPRYEEIYRQWQTRFSHASGPVKSLADGTLKLPANLKPAKAPKKVKGETVYDHSRPRRGRSQGV